MSSVQIKVGGFVKGFTECDGDRVRFVAEDGRDMFDIEVGEDGRSIIVSGISTFIVQGRIYTAQLEIKPHVSNSITVSAAEYKEDAGRDLASRQGIQCEARK